MEAEAIMYKQLFFLTIMDEEQVEDVLERFPKLDERVRDWKVIGQIGDQIIVHVIIEEEQAARLRQDSAYIGRDYKNIAQKAKQGDLICQQVLDEIIFTSWEEDNPDPEGPPIIMHRGKLKEWKEKSKPPKFTKWFPAHVWLGQDVETPEDDEVE